MFALWQYKETSWPFISLLKLIKDLIALTLDGKLFHKYAPLYKLQSRVQKS